MPHDASIIKRGILQSLEIRGPSLPVHLANDIKVSMLFTSAFLSELFSEGKIKMSNMRVGSSPVYFLEGQEPQLERFFEHLRSKEKEAYTLLKEKKFLKDSELLPAIRVALKDIKDFAIPFKSNGELFWRFFVVPENEMKFAEETIEKIIETPLQEEIKDESIEIEIKEEKKIERKKEKKKSAKKKLVQKKDDKFFNRIKEFLSVNSMELLDIENFSKNEIILRIKENDEEKLVIAYDKKKISEDDIIKAFKKIKSNLPYIIISKGETPKKTANLIEALSQLDKIKKME